MIRAIEQNDFGTIHEIWKKYYETQFPFPDFMNYLCAFVVCDDQNRIVTAGGIKLMAEALLITDKNMPLMTRSKAFREMRAALEFMARTRDFNNLYAFIKDDPSWSTILKRVGF